MSRATEPRSFEEQIWYYWYTLGWDFKVPAVRIARRRRGRYIRLARYDYRITYPQTIRKRASKMTGKNRSRNQHWDRQSKRHGRGAEQGLYKGLATAPTIEEFGV